MLNFFSLSFYQPMKYAPPLGLVIAVLLLTVVCVLLDYYVITPTTQGWLSAGPSIVLAVVGLWYLASGFWPKSGGGTGGQPGGTTAPAAGPTRASGGPLYFLAVPATFLGLSGLPWPAFIEQHLATIAAFALAVVVLLVVLALALGRRPAHRLSVPAASC